MSEPARGIMTKTKEPLLSARPTPAVTKRRCAMLPWVFRERNCNCPRDLFAVLVFETKAGNSCPIAKDLIVGLRVDGSLSCVGVEDLRDGCTTKIKDCSAGDAIPVRAPNGYEIAKIVCANKRHGRGKRLTSGRRVNEFLSELSVSKTK